MDRKGFIGTIVWIVILFLVVTALIFTFSKEEEAAQPVPETHEQETENIVAESLSPQLIRPLLSKVGPLFAQGNSHSIQ